MSNYFGLPNPSSATGLTGANLSSLTGLFSYTGLNPQLNAGGPSSLTGSGYFGAKAIVPTTSTPPCAPPAGSSASSNKGPATYSGYDAAVYAAATSYLQSKTQGAEKQWLSKAANSAASGKPGFPAKKPYNSGRTGTGQLYYCELCKISCAGPQTYREHLEGQKHKKKDAEKKAGESLVGLPRSKTSYKCELCDVVCTGQDAYTAHVRGIKHQRAIKLHQTLGKHIPGTSPTVIPAKGADASKMKIVLPTVNFVGGQTLNSTTVSMDKSRGTGANSQPLGLTSAEGIGPVAPATVLTSPDNEPQPIGEDYIEPMKNDVGKLVGYHCKLCDCNFTDVNARDMHLKGRRHRLQFKKKVNPDLEVEIPKSYAFGLMKGRGIRKSGGISRSQDLEGIREAFRANMSSSSMSNFGAQMRPTMQAGNFMGSPMGPVWGSGFQPVVEPVFNLGFESDPEFCQLTLLDNDRYVMKKHNDIYPTEEELNAVQKMVTTCEKALKCVSDFLTDEDAQAKKTAGPGGSEGTPPAERLLKGVMRVGVLAKGLLLHRDIDAELVVLCSEKPTRNILKRVYDALPQHLEAVAGEKFDVNQHPEDGCVTVTSESKPVTKMSISLTSALVREPGADASKPDPPDVLNKQKCLEALASLRHAKWFQAKCSNLQSCLFVLRVMRDLCKRVPTWNYLPDWALELLTEKVISSAGIPLSPGEAFRKIFESVSAGCLLHSGPGLLDPCEKEKSDALFPMTMQQREDITASAQHALRLISFNQIYKVLGVDKLPEDGGPIPVRKRPLEEPTDTSFVEPKKERLEEVADSAPVM